MDSLLRSLINPGTGNALEAMISGAARGGGGGLFSIYGGMLSPLGKGTPGMYARMGRAANSAWKFGLKGGVLFSLPYAAMSAANAPRGKVASHGLSSLISQIAAPTIGGLLGGGVGAILGDVVLQQPIEKALNKVLDPLTELNKRVVSLRQGGGFEDSQQAYTMRARAAEQLSSSLLNARQWLGREGALYHQ